MCSCRDLYVLRCSSFVSFVGYSLIIESYSPYAKKYESLCLTTGGVISLNPSSTLKCMPNTSVMNFLQYCPRCLAWVIRRCNGSSNDDVIRAGSDCFGGCHDPLLIVRSRPRWADARCNNQKIIAANLANQPNLQWRGNHTMQPRLLG